MRAARAIVPLVLVAALAITALGTAALGLPLGGGAASVQKVKMLDDRFQPRSVTIDRGTVVKWTNRGDNDHTSTGSGWNSGVLDPGESYRRTFNQTGTFSYRCNIHFGMRGTIVVQ